jgi:hypothetical protein
MSWSVLTCAPIRASFSRYRVAVWLQHVGLAPSPCRQEERERTSSTVKPLSSRSRIARTRSIVDGSKSL